MNQLSISAAAGLNFAAMYIIVSFLFKVLLAWRRFGTTPPGQGLAAIVL